MWKETLMEILIDTKIKFVLNNKNITLNMVNSLFLDNFLKYLFLSFCHQNNLIKEDQNNLFNFEIFSFYFFKFETSSSKPKSFF